MKKLVNKIDHKINQLPKICGSQIQSQSYKFGH